MVEQSDPVPGPSPLGSHPRYQPTFTVSEGVEGDGFVGRDDDFAGGFDDDEALVELGGGWLTEQRIPGPQGVGTVSGGTDEDDSVGRGGNDKWLLDDDKCGVEDGCSEGLGVLECEVDMVRGFDVLKCEDDELEDSGGTNEVFEVDFDVGTEEAGQYA